MRRFDCLESPLFGPHFLEASAGTGKTFAVEHIFRRLLQSGMELSQILVVTFTRAATRELKLRIRTNLEKVGLADGFEQCQIYTIHGFCSRMLKEFDLNLSEISTDRIDAALHDFFEMKLTSDIVCPEQLELLLRNTKVEELAQKLKKMEEPETAKTFLEFQKEFHIPSVELDKLREDFANLRDSYKKKAGHYDVQLKALAEKNLGPLICERGSLFKFLAPENRKQKFKEPAFLHYPGFFERCRETIPSLIEEIEEETIPALLKAWKPIERKILAEEGQFGPDELLKVMQQAVKNEAFRKKVQIKFRAVLIDEFQDTDPVQWDIFQTLFLDHVEAFYLIGDPKQSIYRFRSADLYTYLKAKESIAPEGHFYLDTNYRSSKELIGVLNRLFDREWLHLPREKKTLPYLPVQAGLDLASTFTDDKGAVHCVLFEEEDEVYAYVAREIGHLGGRRVAILVKDRYAMKKMETVLTEAGIPNTTKNQELLSESFAFEAVEEVFEALFDPRNSGKVKAVIAGPFGELDFFRLREILEKQGLAKLCQALPKVSSAFEQVYEFLFDWERNFGVERILRAFDDCRKMDPEKAPYVRKEATSDAVEIMTMHVSKGLEFEVVFALGLAARTPACDAEGEAEKLRQLYVSMTRAKERLYIPIPLMKKDAKEGSHSPMELFCKALSPEGQWEQELRRLSKETSLTLEKIERSIEVPRKERELSPPEPPIKIPPVQPSYLLSFTALAKESQQETLEPIPNPNGVYTMQNLPRGAETGLFIHKIFERYFSGENYVVEGPWKEAIEQMVNETLDLPLPMGFCLREVKQCRTEVEFLFETSPNYLKGFIDLVFVHENKLYFVDWKTNWLPEYSEERLKAAMAAHQYDLQASIYREALRRSWSGELGGAIYLFVRGPKAICL